MSNENLDSKRWIIAIAAVIMQLSLGTVYAWSVFKKALMASHGWSETATQTTFSICIGVIGLAAAFGGLLVDKKGPRFVATLGGILFGVGTVIAGFADTIGSLYLLWFGYGLIAGVGNGFGYVTPIATLIRWFPDKRGLVTGLAVMGFGAGAFFMGMIAPYNIESIGVANTFFIWGVVFLILVVGAAQFYSNPQKGWLPAGFIPKAGAGSSDEESYSFKMALRTPQWYILWLMLFLNISAGIGLISQLSPMAQDVLKKSFVDMEAVKLAAMGGTILAIASIFNGLGRLFWAWVSDGIGRKMVFTIMFITQAVLYIILPSVASYILFAVMACYMLACYGGGFATMPAFAADTFGPKYIGRIYGTMLTAWGAAGVIGPLVFARIKEVTGTFQGALLFAAVLLVIGFLLAVTYKKPKERTV
ncbi:MAG TPA: MFS transporter [bacterium]|nr:MFS transporter [bacterium]